MGGTAGRVDVAAERGAVCNTDQQVHHLVCAMLSLKSGRHARKVPAGPSRRKFDVENLASAGFRGGYNRGLAGEGGM